MKLEIALALVLGALFLALILLMAEGSVNRELRAQAIARGFASYEIDREDGAEVFTWKEPAK